MLHLASDVTVLLAIPGAVGLLDGICYGVIGGLLIYGLMLVLTFRDRIYGFYLLAGLWSIGTIAILNGHFSDWLLQPDADGIGERSAAALLASWVPMTSLFAHRFLHLRRDAPFVGRCLLAITASAAALALLALGGALALTLAAQAVFALAALALPLLLFGARPSPHYGWRFRGWYLAAAVTALLTLLAMLGVRLGWLAPHWAQARILQSCIVLQAIVYALALGWRLLRLISQQGEMRSRAAELTHAAQTDPLTAVANRAGLAGRARAALTPAAHGTLLIIDLDHFKPINDRFGHATGDEVLVRIASRLAGITNLQDTVARLGGDEFALLLSGMRSRAELIAFAQLAVSTISAPIDVAGRSHQVAASIGIARFPEDARDLPGLLRRADKALYRVKHNGRNGHAFFDDVALTGSQPAWL